MPSRLGRFAQLQWRAGKRASRRHVAKHRRAIVVGSLVLVGGSVILAMLAGHHGERMPGPNAARPVAAAAPSGEPAGTPEKTAQPAGPPQEAALRPPPPPPSPASKPAWLRYAVPAPPTANRPLVAIVFDDLGLDRARTAEAIRLRGPLTMSFMTYANDLGEQTEAARRGGHELFLHVPMEAIDRHADPGPRGLFTALSREENLARLRWGLGRLAGFVGINNHMGSKFTSDAHSMMPVMEELRARGLVFLDSRTSPSSAGIRLAVAYGVPHAARDVFLDDDQAPSAIARQLARLEQVARQQGSAVAIGHPHDATVAALKAWLPQLGEKGLALVPVSAVVRHRMSEEGEARRPTP
jgi:polysaccharide deacetylase 2 family uncharacterized protein YibQ